MFATTCPCTAFPAHASVSEAEWTLVVSCLRAETARLPPKKMFEAFQQACTDRVADLLCDSLASDDGDKVLDAMHMLRSFSFDQQFLSKNGLADLPVVQAVLAVVPRWTSRKTKFRGSKDDVAKQERWREKISKDVMHTLSILAQMCPAVGPLFGDAHVCLKQLPELLPPKCPVVLSTRPLAWISAMAHRRDFIGNVVCSIASCEFGNRY